MNLTLNLNRKKDKDVSETFGHIKGISANHTVFELFQTFTCDGKVRHIVLDLEQADALREWLNKNLPR